MDAPLPKPHSQMIECLPRSLCSWDYTTYGTSSGAATVEYDWLTEQGRIIIGHMNCDVRKHGLFSGHWTLEQSGNFVAEARKSSAMFRSFEINGTGAGFTVQAASAMTRAFEISRSGLVVGLISPTHAFTRRATISCSNTIPEHLQLFAFWLVAMTWRRA